MLIKFFKDSFYSQYLLLLLIAVALWGNAYFAPCTQAVHTESILYNLITGFIQPHSLLGVNISFFILIFSGIVLNLALIRHELLPKNSLLGALVYIVLMSHTNMAISLNPVLLAGILIIPAFDQLMLTYGKPDPTQQVFSAAFLLALASLIYFPAVLILLMLLFSFVIFGTFSIRMFLVALSGAVAVYLYLFLYYFLTDSMEGQFMIYVEWFSALPEFRFPPLGIIYLNFGLLVLLFFAGVLYLSSHMNEWNISVRKKVLLSFWFVVLTLLSLLFEGDSMEVAILLTGIPSTTVVAAYFGNIKRTPRLLEIYFIILIIVIFVSNTFIITC